MSQQWPSTLTVIVSNALHSFIIT